MYDVNNHADLETKTTGEMRKSLNRLVDRSEVDKMLTDVFLGAGSAHAWDYVDLDRPYWKNDTDTAVIAIDPDELGKLDIARALVSMMRFASEARVDEVQSKKVGHRTVVRLWWD
jgi:hypothetical protein